MAERGTIPDAVAAIHRGAEDYLPLPIEPEHLVAAIERATTKSQIKDDLAVTQFPLIGSSEVMSEVKANITKVGPTDSTVIITGQSGTGKEVIARALHASSNRAGAPLITINCATVPGNLIEAELFGLESYDTRTTQRRGLIEAAEGGTLFLDEIDELPAAAQARLLQVLKGENRRVGSSATNPVDVRIISATHRNIEELVKGEQFREDLYYRLNVFNFRLPPLHDRETDVIEIARWLLTRTAQRLGKLGLSFAPDAEQAMLTYAWPGNVRELENAIERAVILSDSNTAITPQALAIEATSPIDVTIDATQSGDLTSLEDYFVKFVQQHQDQLTETELAEKLGISRKSLWERRQRLNIPRRKTRKRGRRQDSASS
ncbi:MAG: AAA domain-containing protein [Pseudomonadales bacterium]|nr:AAA domain-containing protein [Pseudomonadales bacterium]